MLHGIPKVRYLMFFGVCILILYILNILIHKIINIIHMAQGKSKKVYGKKGQKKKVVDSLSRKEWFELKAPAPFQSESFGFTCANRTQGLSNTNFIQKKSKTALKAELSVKCKLTSPPIKTASTGAKSNLLSIRPRADKPSPVSMVLTLPVTSFAP